MNAEASANLAGVKSPCSVPMLQKPGAFRKGTTAHVPENFPTPASTAKVDLDWPPITGSLVTCHLRSVAEPSKVTSTTGGDCACVDKSRAVQRGA